MHAHELSRAWLCMGLPVRGQEFYARWCVGIRGSRARVCCGWEEKGCRLLLGVWLSMVRRKAALGGLSVCRLEGGGHGVFFFFGV